ncbi:Glycerophosphocholine phosphodiesterase [Sorochytrium milnesiophthora]
MKFGKQLARLQHPAWERHYIAYKALKQKISAFLKADAQVDDLEADFYYAIDREVEKVHSFLQYKRAEIERRLLILEEKNKLTLAGTAGIDDEDVLPGSDVATDTALARALLELHGHLFQLHRYLQLNREGFRKIMKKYHKRVPHGRQKDYTEAAAQTSLLQGSLAETISTCDQLLAEVQKRLKTYAADDATAHKSLEPPKLVRTVSKLSELQMQQVISHLHQDAAALLSETLTPVFDLTPKAQAKILHMVLEAACALHALQCVTYLLDSGASLFSASDVNHRALFHKICSGELRASLAQWEQHPAAPSSENGGSPDLSRSISPSLMAAPGSPTLSDSPIEQLLPAGSDFPADGKSAELLQVILDRLVQQSAQAGSPVPRTKTDQLSFLYMPDIVGRRPLHYAALRGDAAAVRVLLDFHVTNPAVAGASQDLSGPIWCDTEGHTPMFYAIVAGSRNVVTALIDVGKVPVDVIVAASDRALTNVIPTFTGSSASVTHASFATTPLFLACKLDHTELVQLLISKGADINYTNEDGEAAVHIASLKNHTASLELLLTTQMCNVNVQDKVSKATALCLAAQEGHESCVSLLIRHGANLELEDSDGFTPYEHAVFRAHHSCSRLLKPTNNKRSVPAPSSPDLSKTSNKPKNSNGDPAHVERSYGHKYLRDNATVLVTLGTNNIHRLGMSPIHFAKDIYLPHTDIPATNSISLVISARSSAATAANGRQAGGRHRPSHEERETAIFDLPIYDASSLEPVAFTCANPEQLLLTFDLQPTHQTSMDGNLSAAGGHQRSNDVLARASALLGSLMKPIRHGGPKETMGIVELPIIENGSMEVIGKLTFEFTVVRPFVNSAPGRTVAVNHRNTYWKALTTKIIGHRGLGMNNPNNSLQIGENTVLSMATAASLGAEYVEFDVQLTKDLVPVLYHDWIVSETGFNIPISDITLEEFVALKALRKLRRANSKVSHGMAADDHSVRGGGSVSRGRGTRKRSTSTIKSTDDLADLLEWPARSAGIARSQSMSRVVDQTSAALKNWRKSSIPELEQHEEHPTANGDVNGSVDSLAAPSPLPSPQKHRVKGNGDRTIQDAFATLEDAFKMVPVHTGFNIEVKFPNADESQQDSLHPTELNLFIDTILECVYRHAGDRNVIFSSFHPQTCLMLNLKQPNYPGTPHTSSSFPVADLFIHVVFFLTEGGTYKYSDVRCNSLREAVRFAKTVDLIGIVTAADPIVDAPRLIRKIKESGLLLFTYGTLNNNTDLAVLQRDWGVDSLIVDSLVAIRNILQT